MLQRKSRLDLFAEKLTQTIKFNANANVEDKHKSPKKF